MKKAIISSFIITSWAVLNPYLLIDNYKNTAEWSLITQFFVLFICCFIIIRCIDNVKEKI